MPSGTSRVAFPCLIKFLNCSKTGMLRWQSEVLETVIRGDQSMVGVGSWVQPKLAKCR